MTIHDGHYAYLRTLVRSRPRDPAMTTFRYQMRLLLREPVWIIIMMIQPLMYLALFGPLLDPISRTASSPISRATASAAPAHLPPGVGSR